MLPAALLESEAPPAPPAVQHDTRTRGSRDSASPSHDVVLQTSARFAIKPLQKAWRMWGNAAKVLQPSSPVTSLRSPAAAMPVTPRPGTPHRASPAAHEAFECMV